MKGENQLVNGGIAVFCFGVLAFLPSLLGRELLILSWLGSWQVPVGISAMVVGAMLWTAGKLQEVRNGPVASGPADPSTQPGVAGPNAAATPTVAPNTIAAPRPNVLSNQVSSEPADRR
jgi:hypothetical protein